MEHTLVVDTGESIIGILSAVGRVYTPYYGEGMLEAIRRIEAAAEVVTYNGSHRDIQDLERFSKLLLHGEFRLSGTHTDMRSVIWSDRIWGSSLRETYALHFSDLPVFEDSYEGSNHKDTYMTFRLWKSWKAAKLKILDGQSVTPESP